MSEINRTHGEWTFDEQSSELDATLPDRSRMTVAVISDPDNQGYHGDEDDHARFWEESRVNGRLMAAAPDLLHAVRIALEDLQAWQAVEPGTTTDTEVIPLLEAAIAKATGGAG
jgi:hypothetical protein